VTEADGTTRIEALNVNSIGRAEVIKGPVSSIYGAGTGGVINFQLQRSPYQEQSLEASGIAGANGLHRIATTYRSGGDKLNSYVAYGWQEYAGYREHSKDMRRFLTGNFQLFSSDRRVITLLLNSTTQYSEIPGSLTAEQVVVNPLQANPVNLDKAAGRYQNWTRIGFGQQYFTSGKLDGSFKSRIMVTASGKHPQMTQSGDNKLAAVYEEPAEEEMEVYHIGTMTSGHDHHANARIVLWSSAEKEMKTQTITDGKHPDHHAVVVADGQDLLMAWVREGANGSVILYSKRKI